MYSYNPLFYNSLGIPRSNRKYARDKTKSICYSVDPYANLHALNLWNIILKQLKHYSNVKYYLNVLWACLGAVENTHLIKLKLWMHIRMKKSIFIPHIFEILSKSTSFKYLSNFKYYLKVLQVCLGAVEITHFMKLNKIIASMDAYLHEKKHLHTSSLWHIILKLFNIKALTLAYFDIT